MASESISSSMLKSVYGMCSWWILPATAITVLWFFMLITKKSRNEEAPLPPGPRGLPVLGYIPFLGTDIHRTFTDLAVIYGPIFKLQLGSKLSVVISSPDLIKQVLRDHDAVFANRDPSIAATIITYGNADVAFSSYGPYWRRVRKIFASQMLSNSNLDSCYDLRREEVHKSLMNVFEKIGTPIDVGELAFVTATSSAISMVMGGTVGGGGGGERSKFTGEFREVVSELMVLLGKPNVSDLLPVLARFDVQGIARKMRKVAETVGELMDSIIEQRVSYMALGEENEDLGTKKRKDILQFLLELKDHGDGDDSASITRVQIRSLIQDIIIGGTDTTATTIEWAMAELLNHPEIMKKAQLELTQVVGSTNTVEESHFPKLHYLNAIIKETLRLRPALPLMVPHRSSEARVVGGYTIPQNTQVFLNVWAVHTDPRIWDDPLEFRPERFLNGASGDYLGSDFRLLPFGSGRRICAGLPLAERMLSHMLASFLHTFEWRLPEGSSGNLDLSDKFGIVLKKRLPLVAVPMPWLSKLDLYA